MVYDIHVIHEGYSRMMNNSTMVANCTCTLLKGKFNIIVDTMTPWDKDRIIEGLKNRGVSCDDIQYVICTHGHSDHIGNNNLFLKAKQHIVGYSINYKDLYTNHNFDSGSAYIIDENVSIIPTPGHTCDDVTVLVKTKHHGTVAVTGDLFEREEDIDDPYLWRSAGSQDPEKQESNRERIINIADFVVPGHGPMFKVTEEHRQKLKLK